MQSGYRQFVLGLLAIAGLFVDSARGEDADVIVIRAAAAVQIAPAAAAAPAAPATPPPAAPTAKNAAPVGSSILYLNDGDNYAGVIENSATANVLRWQATGATEPFEFGVSAIRSAYFAPPA